MSPADLDIARIRLMYRIPAAPLGGKVLDLSVDEESTLRGAAWARDVEVVNVTRLGRVEKLPFGKEAFNVIILHRTLDRLASIARQEGRAFATHEFLARVAESLKSGGIVVGCIDNRYGFDRVVQGARRIVGRSPRAASGSFAVRPYSVPGCRSALEAAGFKEIRLFGMLPGADAPSRLLSIERRLSRRACKQQVELLRPLVGPLGFAVWRALAELGLSQYLGSAILFWGRKSC